MPGKNVNPTRMELTRQKQKLATAVKGHKLLKDKRDELMRQFLDLVREDMELRVKVEKGIKQANRNLVLARAGMSEETLKGALMAPKQKVYLETSTKNVMSVDVPAFTTKMRTSDANDIYSYGFAFTSGDLDASVKSLADLLPDMLRLAERAQHPGTTHEGEGHGRAAGQERGGRAHQVACSRACWHPSSRCLRVIAKGRKDGFPTVRK